MAMESAAAPRAGSLVPRAVCTSFGGVVDRAVLALMSPPSAHPKPDDLDRLAGDLAAAHRVYGSRGMLGRPEEFHRLPPPLVAPWVGAAGFWPFRCEAISFPSEYHPDPDDPAAERWSGYERNRIAYAFMLRHPDPTRPWLICLHGMGAGSPFFDFPAFGARALSAMGLNLLFPVLPLHGPRQTPGKGLTAFMSFDLLEAVHGFSQVVWEVRRLIQWVRGQGASQVGVYGLSLGAYAASLLATLAEVDLLIAGVPLCDLPDLYLGHAPPALREEIGARGLFGQELREIFTLISPLARPSLVPRDRRFIFAGLADQMVPPVQAERLWEHWERPKISWYPGGHVSFFWSSGVQRFVARALRDSGFVPSALPAQ